MHHRQGEEAKPVFIRTRSLPRRWDVSRTTVWTIQRKHPELASEYPFGPGVPCVRLAAVEAFEQRKHAADEQAQTAERANDTVQAGRGAQAVSA